MEEIIKIILDCKKENGRHLFNWRKIKKSYGDGKERSIAKHEGWHKCLNCHRSFRVIKSNSKIYIPKHKTGIKGTFIICTPHQTLLGRDQEV